MPAARQTTELADHQLDELCRLLIGADRGRLKTAIERLQERGQFVDWQSQTLADAMRLALARDPAFAESMGTMISQGVHTTVQRDSTAFGRALAPAMGPAIRNAVWMMLQGFVQSIETVVDQQLSWRSLRWRVEAWRTGRSFAEIAFVHTLLFRVEHVFLLHRDNGLQLLHATRPGVIARDPDLIAAMLTAIQDFLRDAFLAPEGDSATSFAINELGVIVENGNHAALAAVVRGQPRAEIRLQLREALDRIETTMASPLSQFDGETETFEAVRPQLEGCLLQSQRSGTVAPTKRSGSKLIRWSLLTAALVALTWWAIAAFAASAQRDRMRSFVADLSQQPGYVITNSDISTERLAIYGLRDPMAQPLLELANRHSVAEFVTAHLQDYHSLHPEFLARRLQQTLQMPTGVTFELNGRQLILHGTASHQWLDRTTGILAAITGIESVDMSDCQDADLTAFEQLAQLLLASNPPVAQLAVADSAALRTLTQTVRELNVLATRLNRPWNMHANFAWWSADATSTAAQTARATVADLSRRFGMPIELRDYTSDTSLRDATLRFTAKLE